MLGAFIIFEIWVVKKSSLRDQRSRQLLSSVVEALIGSQFDRVSVQSFKWSYIAACARGSDKCYRSSVVESVTLGKRKKLALGVLVEVFWNDC